MNRKHLLLGGGPGATSGIAFGVRPQDTGSMRDMVRRIEDAEAKGLTIINLGQDMKGAALETLREAGRVLSKAKGDERDD